MEVLVILVPIRIFKCPDSSCLTITKRTIIGVKDQNVSMEMYTNVHFMIMDILSLRTYELLRRTLGLGSTHRVWRV